MDTQHVEVLGDDLAQAARQAAEHKLATIESRRLARSLVLPVDDLSVRHALRLRALPVCLFGEDAHDRRERLRAVVAAEQATGSATADGAEERADAAMPDQPGEEGEKPGEKEAEEYYTEGTDQLRELRNELALPSLQRMRSRLARERRLRWKPGWKADAEQAHAVEVEERLVLSVRENQTVFSQIGDTRPLSAVAWGEREGGGSMVATGSWNGGIAVWDGEDGSELQRIEAHNDRISAVSIPREHRGWLLSCGADMAMCTHRLNEAGAFNTKLTVRDHKARVTDVKMHTFRENLVTSVSFDGAMLLYDEDRLVLRQETGHSKVYRVNFHPDGSLVGTCGLEGGLRIWDMRSGRAVMTMERAHSSDVLAVEFNGDGRTMASGGMDNLVRIWDLRTTRCAKTIAAHHNLVSGLRFGGGVGGGDVLYSGSFDGSVKCWGSRRNWGLLAVHTSYEDKVTAVDCSGDGRRAVSACYDRTWKVWGPDGGADVGDPPHAST